jgi:methylated-DNA-[protein]-cysteine S-methyltransferase
MAVLFTHYPSPVGELLLTSNGPAITGLYLETHAGKPRPQPRSDWQRDESVFAAVLPALDAYFATGRPLPGQIPLEPAGTPFQLCVWQALRRIPHGATWSYSQLARHIGQPGASRAVGAANGRNPIAILIPCHRVIGSSGTLTGYGGGMDRKRFLLALEGALPEGADI